MTYVIGEVTHVYSGTSYYSYHSNVQYLLHGIAPALYIGNQTSGYFEFVYYGDSLFSLILQETALNETNQN